MTEFVDLEKIQKNFLNGKISQFVDAYIRKYKVWTPEQMHIDFNIEIENQIKDEVYVQEEKYMRLATTETLDILEKKLCALKWLKTEKGKNLAISRFNKKYLKSKSIAERKSPIQERIRFGFKKIENKYYDINFGLQDGYQYQKTYDLENLTVLPWTVEHVNKELNEKYNSNLLNCLSELSESYLERKFVEYWKNNYYKNESPAIIPEVSGFRNQFYYFIYKENIYTSKKEILEEIESVITYVNFRYDFLIINFKKQKFAFIELDGFEYHKTRKQQTIDSIKRNNSSNNGIPLFTFTSKRITEDIENVFKELEPYLK